MIEIGGSLYLNVVETARLYDVTPGTVRNWRCHGTEPVVAVKIGSAVLYPEAAVLTDISRNGTRGRR